MADVFVSYVSEDRAIAEKISRGLESAGFSVWWDRHIHGGVDFSKEIARQLDAAKMVVVLWSAASLESEWVRDEAQHARDQKKLIPVRLDGVQPPLGFRQAQALDFGGWNGDSNAGAFAGLIASARHFLAAGPPVIPVAASPSTATGRARWGRPRLSLIVGGAILVALAGGLGLLLARNHSAGPVASDVTNGRVEVGAFDEITKNDDTARFAAGLRHTLEHTLVANRIKSVAAKQPSAPDPSDHAMAELLLRGSIDRVQETFKVSADLVRRPEGLVLWSVALEGEPGEIDTTLQQRFSTVVTGVLQCAFDHRRLAKDDPSAGLLGKFLQYCAVLSGQGQISELESFTNQIVEMAPQYAVSHASNAVAAGVLANVPAVSGVLLKPEEEQQRLRRIASDSAKLAMELEPQSKKIQALAYWSLAISNARSGDISKSMQLLEQSMAAEPQFGPSHRTHAQLLSQVGRIDESRIEFERAAGLAPLSRDAAAAHALLVAAFGNVQAGRQELIDIERRTGFSEENDRFWLEYWYGDPRAAKSSVERGRIAEFVLPGYTGGVPRCVDALLEARIQRAPMPRMQFDAVCAHATPSMPAEFEAERGDVDAVYHELHVWEGWYGVNWDLAQTLYLPHMRAVRADPRFMPFAANIGLVDYWLDSGHWPDFCATEKLPYDCKEAALAARSNEVH